MVIGKIGYKNGIVIGLSIVSVGCLIFLPAAYLISYGLFLFGLFVMATGNVFLQVVGNPYVSVLGAPETASSRLTLRRVLIRLQQQSHLYLAHIFFRSI
jgi:FHS family L-fucose permease-like MFS transporter